MHPNLLKIGPLIIRSYGLMLALAFLIGTYLAMGRAKKVGIDPPKILTFSVIIIISAIVGARLFYVLFHLSEFTEHPLEVISPFQDSRIIGIFGLTLYGGLILAILMSLWYAKLKELPPLKVMDIFAPSVALGIAVTRIGCFLNGCCFGKPSSLPWAISFPLDSPAGFTFPGVRLHPTQLYSSLYGLAIFGVLLSLERSRRPDGTIFWSFITFYGIARFGVDFLRYYEKAMTLVQSGKINLNVNQGISLIFLFLGIYMLFRLSRGKTTTPSRDPQNGYKPLYQDKDFNQGTGVPMA